MEEKVRQLMEALHNDPKVRELAKDIKMGTMGTTHFVPPSPTFPITNYEGNI